MRPDTLPYQLSPLTLNIKNHSASDILLAEETQKKTKEAEQRDKVKVTDNSTDEAEMKNQEEELKKETKAKQEKTERDEEETKNWEEEIKKKTWLEPTYLQTTDQQGELPLETAATETAGEETTKMRQAVGQQPEGVHESHDHQTHQRATTMIIDEYLPSGDPIKSFKPADNDYNISPENLRRKRKKTTHRK